MTRLEKTFQEILSNFEKDFNFELLVLYKSELFFVPVERLLSSISILPMKLQAKVVLETLKYQMDKPRFLNLLHDLSLPMLSIRA